MAKKTSCKFFYVLSIAILLFSCNNNENGITITPDMFPPQNDTIQEPNDSTEIDSIEENIDFQNFLSNEIPPGATPNCFLGAYYRKILSSNDHWLGICGTVILPTISFDPQRINPNKPAQYLDNPSIYLGGRADGQETDIGLTWEVIMMETGGISADRRAFRPFYRWASHASSGQKSGYGNAPVQEKHYFYPGDTVFVSVQIIHDRTLRFIVEGKGKKFQTDINCNGYTLDGKGEYKRVNAIDQVGNEGKPVQPTNTKVIGAKWLETYLYRNVEGKIVCIPFNPKRQIDMRCPASNFFNIYTNQELSSKGGEQIDIYGGGVK